MAESPRRGFRPAGQVVQPQPVTEKSFMESVAGFINEVVPQAYNNPHSDVKESITWARFEFTDINDLSFYPDGSESNGNTPPLLLILGYTNGVQVWVIPANGEAQEVLSWRQGVVRTLRILSTPENIFGSEDCYARKRPLVAICDSAGAGPQFCSVSFISLKTGDQVKSIKFKNAICDVIANKRVIVVTFPEKIAVFDACTFEDRFTVTTCYPCPGINPNPLALGTRWLAYAEKKLVTLHRSCGGMEGDGMQSYTATVLHAAKSLTKGLKEFGETVASSLTGQKLQPLQSQFSASMPQGGVVTILDIQGVGRGEVNIMEEMDGIVAHFVAHSNQAIVAMAFDPSGSLLLTADKQGHNFHLFRIMSHPASSSLTAVHHLYILHRGDTTAKVQDITFSLDSRWVAISTLRGTTHIFPITTYGGGIGVRTHTSHRVVNRLSRFQRSAGLDGTPSSGRNSPVLSASPNTCSRVYESHPAIPYHNPRLPPYPHPTLITPLAQLRQPLLQTLASPSPSRNPVAVKTGRGNIQSDESILVKMAAIFAPPRAWLVSSPTVTREKSRKAVDSLFVMACHGNLIEYMLEPQPAAGIPKDKVSDETAIELDVHAQAQWALLRPHHCTELQPPLSSNNPLMVMPENIPSKPSPSSSSESDDADERWLSQVEIVTHVGPHRRLWMGPQFTFKTFQQTTNSSSSHFPHSQMETETMDVNITMRPARSNPVNMPGTEGGSSSVVPVLIEAGSGSSFEQSPCLMEVYGEHGDSDGSGGVGTEVEHQLREDLADAMMETPGMQSRDTGGSQSLGSCEDLSSSSFGSASQASYDARSSPSYAIEHVLVFPSDSSGSV